MKNRSKNKQNNNAHKKFCHYAECRIQGKKPNIFSHNAQDAPAGPPPIMTTSIMVYFLSHFILRSLDEEEVCLPVLYPK